MGGGTGHLPGREKTFAGRLPGRDVSRYGTLNGISPCLYIYLLFVPFRFYGKNFSGTFFVSSPAKQDPGSLASVASWSAASFRDFYARRFLRLAA